jgi:methionine-rich copper-binding protein CopC
MRKASFLVALALLVCLTFATAAPVWAHAELVESHPSGGDVLAKAPDQVRLRFDEPVKAELEPIMVYSEESERVDQGSARVSTDDPKVVSVDLKKLPDGVYGVDWTVTSEDATWSTGPSGSPWTVHAQQTKVLPTPKAKLMRARRWAPLWWRLWRSWSSALWA